MMHQINRVSCWIYFKTMSEHTLRRTVDRHVDTYWVEKLYGRYFKNNQSETAYLIRLGASEYGDLQRYLDLLIELCTEAEEIKRIVSLQERIKSQENG